MIINGKYIPSIKPDENFTVNITTPSTVKLNISVDADDICQLVVFAYYNENISVGRAAEILGIHVFEAHAVLKALAKRWMDEEEYKRLVEEKEM